MEVEVVRFNKKSVGSMECIIVKKFYNTDDANNYYTNWKCDEYDDKDVLIIGNNWNKKGKAEKTEKKIPDNYKYKYTYSVNLWDLIYNDIAHSHNFKIYTK